MGWSKHHPLGLIYSAPQSCYRGYTLIANSNGGHDAHLMDIEGRICHRWHADAGISYASLLPDGHLLVRTHPPQDAGPATGFPGGAASILELDWDSHVVWHYHNPMLHLDFERLPNGHTLVLLWAPLPADIDAQIRGGYQAEQDPRPMLGDVVQEITPDGAVVTQWRSWEHLSPEGDRICPLETRREWTHGNAINVTPTGDWVVSFRQISVVGIVDRATGHFRWKWGPGDISHQHYPTYLPTGRVLLFDNGSHRRGQGVPYSRVIEIDPATDQIVWEYRGEPPFSFYSPVMSSAERLPNGNTLICEGSAGRLFEVTPDKAIVWEYINPVFTPGAGAAGGGPRDASNAVFRAHRYGPDHPALQGKDLDPARYA
jgi:Arylsulfotransferase (ASST)